MICRIPTTHPPHAQLIICPSFFRCSCHPNCVSSLEPNLSFSPPSLFPPLTMSFQKSKDSLAALRKSGARDSAKVLQEGLPLLRDHASRLGDEGVIFRIDSFHGKITPSFRQIPFCSFNFQSGMFVSKFWWPRLTICLFIRKPPRSVSPRSYSDPFFFFFFFNRTFLILSNSFLFFLSFFFFSFFLLLELSDLSQGPPEEVWKHQLAGEEAGGNAAGGQGRVQEGHRDL